jgi:hydroxyacylglutathione hydrolase
MRDVQQYFSLAEREKLRIVAAADTHIHADYVSGLRECAARGITVYASDEGDEDWKYEWLLGSEYPHHLLKNNDTIFIGNIELTALHTPGHTPEHIMYAITDRGSGVHEPMGYCTGDFIFVGDVGRPDLLESAAGYKDAMRPSAKTLYASLLEFMKLPGYRKIWPGHGSGSACGKSLGAVPDSTVGYELRYNIALSFTDSEEKFIDYILKDQPEPPLYFARMKQVNKFGPEILGEMPNRNASAPIHCTHSYETQTSRSSIPDPGKNFCGDISPVQSSRRSINNLTQPQVVISRRVFRFIYSSTNTASPRRYALWSM